MNGLQRSRFGFLVFGLSVLLTGCSSLAGVQERYTVCSYDHVWDAAIDSVKDRSIKVQEKEKGVIETSWLEIPMPGRTFGAFQREMAESKDRSRIIMRVKQMSDVTNVNFHEERQRWAFRGGSRLFGWADAEPSQEVIADINHRLDAKLKERGCTLA
ncbi:MAG TPA: hypothetical protein VJL88_17040 [Nitrospira sp.]|nr:hypothetical protein [Nitrospira sp.]